MTKKLIWRLSNLPTPEELRGLVTDGIITKEEARDVLFKDVDSQTQEKSIKDLEEEVKFLKGIVDKLSENKYQRLVEIVKEVPVYIDKPWYKPYDYWCSNTTQMLNAGCEGTS